MVEELRGLYGRFPVAQIARQMFLSPCRVTTQLRKMGLPMVKQGKLLEPSKAIWIEAASKHAVAAKVAPREVLAGSKSWPHVHARWKAWREILETHPKLSLAGMGRVSGFDHTTIANGLDRLAQMEAAG